MIFKDKTFFITGASRGIGLAIAKRFAKEGANIAIVAKTVDPHPKLPGTIYTAAEEIKAAGGQALAIPTDIRSDEQVLNAVDKTVKTFGGIDVCINNASAIYLLGPQVLKMKQYDLMHQINGRGTYLCSTACFDHLLKSENPHILNISPPLNMDAGWFKSTVAYTQAKYLMSMSTLGMAEAWSNYGILVNSLWPRTAIDTAAVRNLFPVPKDQCRKPDIVADAAFYILSNCAKKNTGNFYIDEEVLKKNGIKDLSKYSINPKAHLMPDAFIGSPKKMFTLIDQNIKSKK